MSLLLFFKRNNRSCPATRLDLSTDGSEIRRATLSYLRTHRDWYAKWSSFYAVAWNLSTFLVIGFGALAAVLTASERDAGVPRWVLIALPAASSLLAASMVQFRFRDLCALRDNGRIAAELLICRAFLIPTDDAGEAMRAAVALRALAHALERAQLESFASERARGSDGAADGGGSDRSAPEC